RGDVDRHGDVAVHGDRRARRGDRTVPRALGGEDGVDRRVRALERRGEPRDFRRHVVDALAQQRVLDALVRPGLFRLALYVGEVAGDAVAIFLGVLELGGELGVLGLELLRRRGRTAVELGDRRAQIGFRLLRGLDLAADLAQLEVALGQETGLLGQAVLEVLGAAA